MTTTRTVTADHNRHAAALYAAKAAHGYDLRYTPEGVLVSAMCRCGRSSCMTADLLAALIAEQERADAAEATLTRVRKIQQRLAAGKAIGVIRQTVAYDLAAVLDTTE